MFENNIKIANSYDNDQKIVLHHGNCLDLLSQIPDKSIQLIVTSPPYNIGKEYEKKQKLEKYLAQQKSVICECERVLKENGSICWQVRNYVHNASIIPLDIVLYPLFSDLGFILRNRIIWHFAHGLHCSKRFSGRYESIIWFTRKTQNYLFNLDAVRIPQKYPGKKYFKGPKAGQYSCNPLGKNPGDVWDIPNVKNNHVEKTDHPCQFPVELVERLVLAMSDENDWVFDPFLGSGTTIVAAIRHNRRGAGAETEKKFVDISATRIREATAGTLRVRPMNACKYDPDRAKNKHTKAPWKHQPDRYPIQPALFDKREACSNENS